MRIAFVGKGGSGKTTTASLFTQHALRNFDGNIYVVDADLNMHMAKQLGLEGAAGSLVSLSDGDAQENIKKHLIGNNKRIESSGHFKKTTPPAEGSNLINLSDRDNYVFQNYSISDGEQLFLSAVGTYSSEKIGKSCYHDSLAIFENILTHTDDSDSVLIADMVAGIDAFANTLHAQFDVLVFCVEPTKKSIEVFLQYEELAAEANIENNVFVVVNKVRDSSDLEFVSKFIDPAKIVGVIGDSNHIRNVEKEMEELDVTSLEEENIEVIDKAYKLLQNHTVDPNSRLKKIHDLHESYVQQGYVKDRFGDLSKQIDPSFKF